MYYPQPEIAQICRKFEWFSKVYRHNSFSWTDMATRVVQGKFSEIPQFFRCLPANFMLPQKYPANNQVTSSKYEVCTV